MIKAVAFDMGSVYIHASSSIFYKKAAKYFGISEKEMREEFHRQRGDFQKGKIGEADFWKRFGKKYSKSVKLKDMKSAWDGMTKKMKVIPGMPEIVRELKKSYKVGIISNTVNYHYNFIRKNGWYRPFRPVICSCKVGYRKPEREIYMMFLRKAKVKASETVFVDDNKYCTDGARRAGMKAILFKNPKQLKRELKKLGVEI